MTTARSTIYPAAAVEWMVGPEPRTVLDVGSGDGRLAAMMTTAGHHVTCIDSDPARAQRIAKRLPPGRVCIAKAESLPIRSFRYDVVTVQESFTRFAPGLALAEFARVLRPGGHVAVVFTSRDDTVPWVKRLARRLQEEDPTAMVGDFGRDTIAALESSNHFTDIDVRTFRTWVPITRDSLLAMVRQRPAIARLPEDRRSQLLDDVGELYDSSARTGELLLPFQAVCRRAWVDQSELTQPMDDDGLRISMRF